MNGIKYYIVEIAGHVYQHIDVKGNANKYGECKYFDTFEDAAKWVKRHTYIGMSHYYAIRMKDGSTL